MKQTKKLIILCSMMMPLLLSSCGSSKISGSSEISYNKVYNLRDMCTLNDHLWGEWKPCYHDDYSGTKFNFGVTTQYNDKTFTIVIYYKGAHPSEYRIKMTIDKTSGVKNGEWIDYQGTVSTISTPLYDFSRDGVVVSMGDGKVYFVGQPPDKLHDLRCTYKVDAKMQRAIQQNGLYGTINVFYGDGKGNGFGFY